MIRNRLFKHMDGQSYFLEVLWYIFIVQNQI